MRTISMRRALGIAGIAALAAAGCSSGGDNAVSSGSGGSSPAVAAGATGTAPGTTAPGAGPSGAARGGAPIARYAGFSDPTYADQRNWLCGDRAASSDRCLTADLTTTVVRADGSTEVRTSTPAASPAFDCFYVYPTVNFGAGGGNDEAMAADTANEDSVIKNQAARLREQCRVYAPLYRQVMLSGSREMAYGDVRNAWKHYMAQWNEGRPVLLVGHSQGSGMLAELMKEEFDGDAELRGRLVSAWLLGGGATTADGQPAGGSFTNIPVCTTAQQNGCVIAYNSVAASGPDDDRTRWGGAPAGQLKVCTNPAALGGGSGVATPIGDKAYVTLRNGAAITTPFVELPDAVKAECTTKSVPGREDGAPTAHRTLDFAPNTGDGDVRDVTKLVTPGPSFWALHIQEMQLVMRDLLELLEQQTTSLR